MVLYYMTMYNILLRDVTIDDIMFVFPIFYADFCINFFDLVIDECGSNSSQNGGSCK